MQARVNPNAWAMKALMGLLLFVAAMLSLPVHAQAPASTQAQAQLDLLRKLKDAGYLSGQCATEAASQFVNPAQTSSPSAGPSEDCTQQSFMERWLNWTNTMVLIGVGLLLWATAGTLRKVAKWAWPYLRDVPPAVAQVPLLGASVYAMLWPGFVSASASVYVALFASILNIMVLSWMAVTYPKIGIWLADFFKSLNVPASSVMCFVGMLYFGALAIQHNSQVFGFLATVMLSGVFTFIMLYVPGILFMDFKHRALPAVVFGHLLVLALYVGAMATIQLPPESRVFATGLEIYCTLAMGVGLLVGASPFPFFRVRGRAAYVVTTVLVAFAATLVHRLLGLEAMGTIAFFLCALVGLEWLLHIGNQVHSIVGIAFVGGSLIGFGLLANQYSHLIVLRVA